MTQAHIALLLDDTPLTLEEFSVICSVSHEWVIEHVQAGVLPARQDTERGNLSFSAGDLTRARRMHGVERDFDANPELAALVTDLFEELDRLRGRLRHAGLSPD